VRFHGSVHHNTVFVLVPSSGYYSPHCRFQPRSSPKQQGARWLYNGSEKPQTALRCRGLALL
jgi:hypothetical protein